MKLNLGCGKCYIPGWVNLDLFSSVKADIYADVTALPYPHETFDIIYASHILEHVHRRCILATLSHWKDLLKQGGTLRLAVPNFEAVCEHYTEHRDLDILTGLLYGGQNHPLNSHTITFDQLTLTNALKKVGFKDVCRWRWQDTEHAQYDDYSRCVLPHLDFENGKLMSLNVECRK